MLGAIPAIDVAVALVNRGVTLGFGASPLPGLELRDGIPSHLRTLVAVPTLLTTLEAIEEQIERLEIHHLASPEGDLHFALLSDWIDAATEHDEGDDDCSPPRAKAIARLNRALRPGARRRALPAAASPAGLERRRRPMDRLGAQARQAARIEPAAARRDGYHFMPIDGTAPLAPADVRYVVTLDADTRLPRETRPPADRQDGASAQPPAFRRRRRQGRGRLCAYCSRG